MHGRPNPVEALATLTRVEDSAERRASWRQAITALGHRTAAGLAGAPPLEGMSQEVIARAAQVAIDVGLADDLDWLAPGPATVALYEITAALPPGKTRRELGRRVFARLYQGTASTFAAVASRMALTSARPFEPATLRARVGLLFDLPIGSTVNADPLALTLVSRRELRERWIIQNRTGTLPARRLAAKLLEHAAREAVFRYQQGDPHPREILLSEALRGTTAMLLADREPLVWRHVAVARGLLAAIEPSLREEIELSLDPALSPTEWRRGAVSLVASCSGDAENALRACRQVLDGPLGELDRGMAAALVLGLPRVIEAEPDAAEEILGWLAQSKKPDVAEAVAGLLADLRHPNFGAKAAQVLRQTLTSRAEHTSSVLRAIAERALRQLDREEDENDLLGLVKRALLAYENSGAREAFELATQAVKALGRSMDFVAINNPHDEQVLPYLLGTLNDIDAAALERPRLMDLLLLGRRPGETEVSVPEMDQLYDRLGRWLLHAESTIDGTGSSNAQVIGEQRRLRALLHLMDVDATRQEDDKKVLTRVSRALGILLGRVTKGERSPIHRIACAALARACDAAVREGSGEPADLLMLLASALTNPRSYRAIGEASTNPDVRDVITAYADFLSPLHEGSEPAPESVGFDIQISFHGPDEALNLAERVVRLSRGLGAGGSYRGEALRRIVLRLGRSLELVAQARGQAELVDSSGAGSDVLGDLEASVDDLQRLARGAGRRLIGEDPADIAVVAEVPAVSALIERSVRAAVPPNSLELGMAIRELVANVPKPIADAVSKVLSRLETLPIAVASDVFAIPLERRRVQLPDWLLPHRTIGSFYVVRSLGSGGASSVFLARRLEQRNNKAEGFALKVPDYDPTTARSLSEQEFLQLFREEAGALLSLPEHENLARFVTFDAGARPKPILVMELIRGASLDRLIRSRSLTTERALAYLDGILAGIEAMHGVGIGHLDVKPSNVILRDGEVPVLVDFGLSGRHLRPGCGTIDYSAPEVLGVVIEGHASSPLPTDLYAFGCTAFEALTADLLFDGEGEADILGQHVAHDGWPARLTPFAHSADTAEVAKLIAACLRRDPRHRPTAAQARTALAKLTPRLTHSAWPLVATRPRQAAAS